ncbi:MAG: helical backbone metal receptor [Nitrospirota bacterium]
MVRETGNYRQKKPLKCYFLSCLLLLVTCHLSPVTSVYAGEVPKRIISLAPNITEILYSMGLGDRIVGVTAFCDYPVEARKKKRIGGMSNPSLEAVVSLKPDIVVMTTDGNTKEFEERLHSLKIKTYVFKAKRLHELPQGIRDLGTALGVKEKAEGLAKEMEGINSFLPPFNSPLSKGGNRGVKGRHGGINNPSLKKKVLFIIWPEPLIVAGPGTAIDDVISLLGCENIAKGTYTSYPKYSVEEIIRKSPDVIFIGKGHMKETSRALLKRISNVPAVKSGEVYYVSDSIYRLGPRALKGIEEMARCLR